MKIAILGGGFTGLTAAFYLSKKNHTITLFEKEKVLGGLAVGFKADNWDWHLERAYHHLFASDKDIVQLAKDSRFDGIFFQSPCTDSLYEDPNSLGVDNYRIFSVDTPQDFLLFPYLPLLDKIRAVFILACLKFSPPLALYEKMTAAKFISKFMGERVWRVFWHELFRKKFGKYAEKVLASFIWARIKVRTKNLGYIKGGFQTFTDYLEKVNAERGVTITKGVEIQRIEKKGSGFKITHKDGSDTFDCVISTLPTPVMARVTAGLFPRDYIDRLKKIDYLHALVLILETEKPLLKKTYWLNICAPSIPIMFIAQHTNFIDKKHYGGKHLAYIGYYLDNDDPKLKMSKEKLIEFLRPHLKQLSPNHQLLITNSYLFKAPFAQPIFDKEFIKNKPDFITSVKNFYISNLDMTYPYDRGTNYAVKLGREVSQLL